MSIFLRTQLEEIDNLLKSLKVTFTIELSHDVIKILGSREYDRNNFSH